MSKKNILHMISPQENVSPFDVNMACDAGYDVVIPYTSVNLTDVKGLVQDAIFSRSVNNAKKTGVFKLKEKPADKFTSQQTRNREKLTPTKKQTIVKVLLIKIFPFNFDKWAPK